MALELPREDGGTVEGSGVVEEVTELGMTYELERPMAYSYTATIDLFNPSQP